MLISCGSILFAFLNICIYEIIFFFNHLHFDFLSNRFANEELYAFLFQLFEFDLATQRVLPDLKINLDFCCSMNIFCFTIRLIGIMKFGAVFVCYYWWIDAASSSQITILLCAFWFDLCEKKSLKGFSICLKVFRLLTKKC